MAPPSRTRSVSPQLVPFTHPLATVNNENNAVLVNDESVGEVMLYGPGAGEMPGADPPCGRHVQRVRQLRRVLPV